MATQTRERTKVAKAKAGDAFEMVYHQLTPRQREAVDAIEGPVMVLAGPGTGKTQVLAMRVANILRETQMDPWNILCLTFTESGVTAMRERLLEIMGPTAYQVRVYTFHGFCNSVIQDFPEKFARSASWQVLTDLERVALVREIVDGLSGRSPLKPFGEPYLYVQDIIQTIAHLKQERILPPQFEHHLEKVATYLKETGEDLKKFFALSPKQRTEAVCEEIRALLQKESNKLGMNESWKEFTDGLLEGEVFDSKTRTKIKNRVKRWFDSYTRQLPRQRELLKVYREYQAALVKKGRYDYADMILSVIQQLGADDELLAHYQEQFQYLLVDEYQDTNNSQNEFLKLLGSVLESPNIFVVGDDKQSIFRFQGASLENLRFFYAWQKGTLRVISLVDNFRSQQHVVTAAGEVIARNTETVARYIPGVEVALQAATKRTTEHVHLTTYASEEAEVTGVAQDIQRLLKEGVPPREIAVLYRYNRDAAGIREALSQAGIPARVETPENVLEDVQIRQFTHLLTYLTLSPGSAMAEVFLGEIIQYQFWNFESLHVMQVLRQAGRERKMLSEALEKTPAFQEFAHKLATWRAAAANYTVQQFVDILLHESGYLNWVLEHPGFGSGVGRLSRLLAELKQLNRTNHALSLKEFVEQLKLMQEYALPLSLDPSQYTADGRVRLMTAHKSKGLEFEHVFIIHLSHTSWGNVQSRERLPLPHGLLLFDATDELFSSEDERRLFYVAMTRAKQGLHLSQARHNAQGREQIPAVFWQEVPKEVAEEIVVPEDETIVEARMRLSLTTKLGVDEKAEDEGVRAWLIEQLSNYTLSVTHLNNYLECPRLFYYRNLLRVPMAKTKHMAFGSAMHAALTDFFQEFRDRGELPGKEFLLDQFTNHLKREVLTETELADSEAVGREALTNYYAQYQAEFAPDVLLDYDFVSHGVEVAGVRLTGKLDKVEILDAKKKTVQVVDYKTGNPDTASAELKKDGKYFRQLAFYQLLTELSPRFDYTMVSGQIDFLQPSKRTGKLVKKTFEITSKDLSNLKAEIARVWQEIQNLEFLDPTKACGECEYCLSLK